jgi:short-subunit dehydrogenase
MNHVWSVPGCESPWGLFSGINPVLDTALGTRRRRVSVQHERIAPSLRPRSGAARLTGSPHTDRARASEPGGGGGASAKLRLMTAHHPASDDDGRRVLITGASSGIGAALAVELARRGDTVGIVARRTDRLGQVLEACRVHAPASQMWPGDVGEPDAAATIVAGALDTFGRIDVLVNNAAIPGVCHATRLDAATVARVMDVNFHAPVRFTLAALPHMLERGSGAIVNVSSLGGRLGILRESAYCASKFAVCGWTESLQLDLWDTPLRVKLIIPGAVDTEIWEHPDAEPASYDGPKMPVDEVAVAIADAIDDDGFEYYIPDMKAIAVFKTEHIDRYLTSSYEALC